MASLHTLNKTASAPCFQQCLQACDETAGIVLIEDGVYNAVDKTPGYHALNDCPAASIYALTDDLEARGIGGKLGARITPIDYAQFVDLCCQHQPVLSWY